MLQINLLKPSKYNQKYQKNKNNIFLDKNEST